MLAKLAVVLAPLALAAEVGELRELAASDCATTTNKVRQHECHEQALREAGVVKFRKRKGYCMKIVVTEECTLEEAKADTSGGKECRAKKAVKDIQEKVDDTEMIPSKNPDGRVRVNQADHEVCVKDPRCDIPSNLKVEDLQKCKLQKACNAQKACEELCVKDQEQLDPQKRCRGYAVTPGYSTQAMCHLFAQQPDYSRPRSVRQPNPAYPGTCASKYDTNKKCNNEKLKKRGDAWNGCCRDAGDWNCHAATFPGTAYFVGLGKKKTSSGGSSGGGGGGSKKTPARPNQGNGFTSQFYQLALRILQAHRRELYRDPVDKDHDYTDLEDLMDAVAQVIEKEDKNVEKKMVRYEGIVEDRATSRKKFLGRLDTVEDNWEKWLEKFLGGQNKDAWQLLEDNHPLTWVRNPEVIDDAFDHCPSDSEPYKDLWSVSGHIARNSDGQFSQLDHANDNKVRWQNRVDHFTSAVERHEKYLEARIGYLKARMYEEANYGPCTWGNDADPPAASVIKEFNHATQNYHKCWDMCRRDTWLAETGKTCHGAQFGVEKPGAQQVGNAGGKPVCTLYTAANSALSETGFPGKPKTPVARDQRRTRCYSKAGFGESVVDNGEVRQLALAEHDSTAQEGEEDIGGRRGLAVLGHDKRRIRFHARWGYCKKNDESIWNDDDDSLLLLKSNDEKEDDHYNRQEGGHNNGVVDPHENPFKVLKKRDLLVCGYKNCPGSDPYRECAIKCTESFRDDGAAGAVGTENEDRRCRGFAVKRDRYQSFCHLFLEDPDYTDDDIGWRCFTAANIQKDWVTDGDRRVWHSEYEKRWKQKLPAPHQLVSLKLTGIAQKTYAAPKFLKKLGHFAAAQAEDLKKRLKKRRDLETDYYSKREAWYGQDGKRSKLVNRIHALHRRLHWKWLAKRVCADNNCPCAEMPKNDKCGWRDSLWWNDPRAGLVDFLRENSKTWRLEKVSRRRNNDFVELHYWTFLWLVRRAAHTADSLFKQQDRWHRALGHQKSHFERQEWHQQRHVRHRRRHKRHGRARALCYLNRHMRWRWGTCYDKAGTPEWGYTPDPYTMRRRLLTEDEESSTVEEKAAPVSPVVTTVDGYTKKGIDETKEDQGEEDEGVKEETTEAEAEEKQDEEELDEEAGIEDKEMEEEDDLEITDGEVQEEDGEAEDEEAEAAVPAPAATTATAEESSSEESPAQAAVSAAAEELASDGV